MRVPTAVLVALAVFIPLSYLVLLPGRPASEWLHDEDGAVEWFGTIALFVASALAFSAWLATRHNPDYRGLKRLVLLGLALVLLFGAGEEISWGQRIFGWGTPDEIAEVNRQGETNVHNLKFWGFLNITRLAALFWLTFIVLIPAVCAVRPAFRRMIERFVPVLPLSLGIVFVYLYVVMKSVQYGFPEDSWDGPYTAVHAIVETREAHVQLVAMVALMCIRFSLPRRDAPRGEDRATAPPTRSRQTTS